MFWTKKVKLSGISRIVKVVESFKEQIADLDLGITEVDEATAKNNIRVEKAEERLIKLKENVHTENDLLSVNKKLANNLKSNIQKLFVVE